MFLLVYTCYIKIEDIKNIFLKMLISSIEWNYRFLK